ncbi:MAG: hypothetical protein IJW54_00305 [Clostridia bacterium]|nr:hypothetical protein [Clostridia bacterium]
MKYTIIEKKDNIKGRVKASLELCLLTFVICALSLFVYFAKAPEKEEVITNDDDIVSVFKESDAYYFFGFDEIEEMRGGVEKFDNFKEHKTA